MQFDRMKPPAPKMPAGLVEIMEGLAKEVLRNNPPNLYEYCASHMQKLLEIRDGPCKKVITLDQKIKKAQEMVKQRAEVRRQLFEKIMSNFRNNDNSTEDNKQHEVDEKQYELVSKYIPKDNLANNIDVENNESILENQAQNSTSEKLDDENENYSQDGNVDSIKNNDLKCPGSFEVENNTTSAIENNVGVVEIENGNINPIENPNKLISEESKVLENDEILINTENDAKQELNHFEKTGKLSAKDAVEKISLTNESSIEVENHLNPTSVIESDINLVEKIANDSISSIESPSKSISDEPKVLENDEITVEAENDAKQEPNNVDHVVKMIAKDSEENRSLTNEKAEAENLERLGSIEDKNHLNPTSAVDKDINFVNEMGNKEIIKFSEISSKSNSDQPKLHMTLDTPVSETATQIIDDIPRELEDKPDVRLPEIPNIEEENKNKSLNSNNSFSDSKYIVSFIQHERNEIHVNTQSDNNSIGDLDNKLHRNLEKCDEPENHFRLLESDAVSNKPENKQSNEEVNNDCNILFIDDNCEKYVNDEEKDRESDDGSDSSALSVMKSPSLDENSLTSGQHFSESSKMDLETAAVTIQKVFRSFLNKSRSSTFEEVANDELNSIEEVMVKKEIQDLLDNTNANKERRGLSRMDTVLQTVNEEKSLSLDSKSEDSSTLSSAATIIQAHFRGYLTRNKLNSCKTTSNASQSNDPSLEAENDHQKNKTVLNIHIVPDGGHFMSRDESMAVSIDLPLDNSPQSSVNLHPLGYDKSEPRKQLKREDAVQSVSPPSNNSGKLSEDVDSIKDSFVSNKSVSSTDSKEAKVQNDETKLTKTNTLDKINEMKNLDVKDVPLIIHSDDTDVISPTTKTTKAFIESSEAPKLLHSGEFHDVVLPTKVARSSSVVRDFKEVLAYILIWN